MRRVAFTSLRLVEVRHTRVDVGDHRRLTRGRALKNTYRAGAYSQLMRAFFAVAAAAPAATTEGSKCNRG